MSTRLVFDTAGRADAVGELVRRSLKTKGPLRFAVAYVSGDLAELLGLRRSQWRRVSLICDPFSGGCNPRVLLALHRAGATVSFIERLHAKVFISKTALVVGSANISSPALAPGNIEAGCIVRGQAAVARAVKWFDSLRGRPLADAYRDRREWAAIEAAWLRAQRRTPASAQSLLSALNSNDEILRDYVFSVCERADANATRAAAQAAKAFEFRVPETWVAELRPADGPRALSRLRQAASGKVVLAVQGRFDKQDNLIGFASVDRQAWVLERVLHHKGSVVSYLAPARSDVRLGGADAKMLCKNLTEGLRRHPRVASRLDFSSFVIPADLAKLLRP